MFGLHPQFLAHSSPNPWNCLSNKSNGIFGLLSSAPGNTLGQLTSRVPSSMGLVARRTDHVFRGLEFSVPLPSPPHSSHFWGTWRGLRLNQLPLVNDSVNHDNVMKSP